MGAGLAFRKRMGVGRDLQAARTARGLSLDELSARTKVSAERLKAIEDENVDQLPSVVYLRGFVRAYADEVGLEPDATVRQYIQEIERSLGLDEFDSEPPNQPAEEVQNLPFVGDQDDLPLHDRATLPTNLPENPRVPALSRRELSAVAVLAGVGLSVYAAIFLASGREPASKRPANVSTHVESAAEPRTSSTPPSAADTTRQHISTAAPDSQLANLTGEWRFTNEVQASRVRAFKGMTLGFRMRLVQDGRNITGSGVKVAENGRHLPTREQTAIVLHGDIEGDRVELTFTERGRRRTSKGTLVMDLLSERSMSGQFVSDAAASHGRSRAVRVAGR